MEGAEDLFEDKSRRKEVLNLLQNVGFVHPSDCEI
jgi:hypothetical protein